MVTAHIFSVDLEEYFQVYAFEGVVAREDWGTYPSRVERSTDVLLELLARTDSTATFFTLGWIADKYPALVRRIAEAGHEIASHGWWHHRVPVLSPGAFQADVRDSKRILEDASGQQVLGYRAPTFSIVPGCEWALDALLEEGYAYDSSLYPITRDGYGYPGTHPYPHIVERPSGRLIELPPATIGVGGKRLPAAGGGWFRQFPYGVTRRALNEHAAAGHPGMFYIHPWEIDPEQPRLPVGWKTRVRHYRGLASTLPKMERMMEEFRFISVATWLVSEAGQRLILGSAGALPTLGERLAAVRR